MSRVVGEAERARAAAVAATAARVAEATGTALGDGLLLWRLAGGRPPASPGPGRTTGGAVTRGATGHPPDGGATGRARGDRASGRAAGAVRGGGTHGGAAGHVGDDGVPGGPADQAVDQAPEDGPDALAVALERATDPRQRRARGLHVTPRWLADRLVALGLPSPAGAPAAVAGTRPTVCDPACGGGAFLVAAGRRLEAAGWDRRTVVRRLLWGADVDPVGVAAAEAALALWAGEAPPPGRLVVGDPLAEGAATWPEPAPGGFAAVVGNPPFQSQLGRATARSRAEHTRLRARYGPAVRAYTDTAWLFLLLGCELARPGGRVVLVEPQSVVAARDAEAVRAAVDARARLVDLWLDDRRVFAAAVRVCAPVLERRPDGAAAAGPGAEAARARWRRLWADALGLPPVALPGRVTLGERATVVAGFRDQYYGLVAAVRELDEDGDGPAGDAGAGQATVAPLVTSGTIDWATCAWGQRPVRFAKRRWQAPVVDLARLGPGVPAAARRWVSRTRVPKLVVASQTRVVEAAVDVAGRWVPSVPTVAVVPHDPHDLWRLAAAVLAPAATAWLAARTGGTGLDRGVLKVAAPDLVALPLPADDEAWQAAAAALAAYAAAPGAAALATYLEAAARAYGTDPQVSAWWARQAGPAVRRAPAGG